MPTPETMKEYFDRLNKMRNKTPAQIAFLEAVKAVNTASAKLRKPDRFKCWPRTGTSSWSSTEQWARPRKPS